MSIKLSVCITAYNRAPLLDRSLKSLSGQIRLPDEVIVSDDCSKEDPESMVQKWRGYFPRLIYNRNRVNLNMPGNLNVAISLAGGEYIANLHDADEFAPSLLKEWEEALDNYPTAGFVFCGIAGWNDASRYGNGIILHNVPPFTPGRRFFEEHLLHRFSSIVWGTVMARRSAYSKLLPFDEAFSFISDVDMWMRMCLYFDVAYVRKPLIVLDNDHSPAKWGISGKFNWKGLDLSRRIQETNIKRFYCDQPSRVRTELRRNYWITQRAFGRHLLGRLKAFDWEGLKEGLRLWWKLNGH